MAKKRTEIQQEYRDRKSSGGYVLAPQRWIRKAWTIDIDALLGKLRAEEEAHTINDMKDRFK